MSAPGGLRSCTSTEFSAHLFINSTLIPHSSAGSHCDLTLLTCLLIGSYRFCIIPLLAAFNGKARVQLWKSSAPAVCKPDSKPPRPGPQGGPAPRLLGKSPITKAMGVRNRVQSPQGKGMTAGTKNAALPSQTPSKSAPGPLHRTGSARFQRPATGPPVGLVETCGLPRSAHAAQ
ncbi:hypothetical protein AGOR_G00232490 [Albula goreensis]|uniref:Uncharacterized protein n=1 Tax=Albula goreensis TaxID=1534307 RepID=A0A8T3CET3_9TELE|nr:hypothetical protein AGOR_G00232490 [Albula goreensis]